MTGEPERRSRTASRRTLTAALLVTTALVLGGNLPLAFARCEMHAEGVADAEPNDGGRATTETATWVPAKGVMPLFYLTLGFIGQFLFGIRFLIQWIASERSKAIVIPRAFWWVSILGAVTTGIYSVSILAYPIIMSQGLNCVIYGRSLYLSYDKTRADISPAETRESARAG